MILQLVDSTQIDGLGQPEFDQSECCAQLTFVHIVQLQSVGRTLPAGPASGLHGPGFFAMPPPSESSPPPWAAAAFPSVAPRLAPPASSLKNAQAPAPGQPLGALPVTERREPQSSGAGCGGSRAERRAGCQSRSQCRPDEGRQWNTPAEERALGTPTGNSNRT